MDIKKEIKHELGDSTDISQTPFPCHQDDVSSKQEVGIAEGKQLSSMYQEHFINKIKEIKIPHRNVCYKKGRTRYNALLKCPSCDKSFKGGKSRLPCLIKHFRKSHQCRMIQKLVLIFRVLKYDTPNAISKMGTTVWKHL